MNNKKIKSFTSFSIILLALAIIGQFYTNYKIDQILSQFPYHLDNKFKISIIEKNSDFFTRDLTFSLEQNDHTTDFIHTTLTALPAMISAESHLSPMLVKKLNQQLNITIDQNTITNQFLVFNDNLISKMLTNFRDGTNKPHSLESELSYYPKNGNIELKTQLSGFNYDNLIEIKELTGHFKLQPISESLYDISKANLKAKNIDINLLDGEDTHIAIVKGEYEFNKNLFNKMHNLEHNFKFDNIYALNKYTTSEQDRTQFKNVNLFMKKTGVPTNIDFITSLKQINILEPNKLIEYFSNILFNNQNFYSKVNFDSFSLPTLQHRITLGKTQFILNLQNQDKQQAEHLYNLKIDNFTLFDNNHILPTVKLNDLEIQNKFSQINLDKNLDFLLRYIPKKTNELTKHKNSQRAFLKDLKDFTANYKTELVSEIKVKKLSFENNIDNMNIENFKLLYKQKPFNNKLEVDSIIELDKLMLAKQQVNFHQTKLHLPAKLFFKSKDQNDYICIFPVYNLICDTYLDKPNNNYISKKTFQNLSGEINNAHLTSYMGSNLNEKSIIGFNLNINTENLFFDILREKKSDLQLKGSIANELIELNKPNTIFWQEFFGFLIDLSLTKNQQNNRYEFEFTHKTQ